MLFKHINPGIDAPKLRPISKGFRQIEEFFLKAQLLNLDVESCELLCAVGKLGVQILVQVVQVRDLRHFFFIVYFS